MLLVAIFIFGYLAIVFEHTLQLNKAASALLAGVLCWTAYIVGGDAHVINEQLLHHLAGIAQIVFFLLGAMTIVELIDAHDGFELITRIRESGRPAIRGVPAAALTAYARSDERARALRAGFQMHLSKPINPVELVDAVRALSRTRADESGAN